MRHSKWLVLALGIIVGLAGVLASGWSVWWLAPIRWLGQYQVFHIVAHFTIFASLAVASRGAHLWIIALVGGLSIELAQVAVGGFALSRPLLLDCTFDLVVDIAGALFTWLVLAYRCRLISTRAGSALYPL